MRGVWILFLFGMPSGGRDQCNLLPVTCHLPWFSELCYHWLLLGPELAVWLAMAAQGHFQGVGARVQAGVRVR